jgi:hypothetical protein
MTTVALAAVNMRVIVLCGVTLCILVMYTDLSGEYTAYFFMVKSRILK